MADYRQLLEGAAQRFQLPQGAMERLLERRERQRRKRRLSAGVMALVIATAGLWSATVAFHTKTGPARPGSSSINPSTVSRLRLAWTGAVLTGGAISETPPVVADGIVYVTSIHPPGEVFAFPAACGTGGASCRPLWRSAACGTGGAICRPRWKSPTAQSFRYSNPAAGGGFVYVTSGGKLYAFREGCRSRSGVCQPAWTGPATGSDQAPTVAGMVYVTSSDGLYAFRPQCSAAVCDPVWTASVSSTVSPAVGEGILYVTTSDGRLVAFPAECRTDGTPCRPLWSARIGNTVPATAPVIAGGVVYVASDRLYAFLARCENPSAPCTPLWRGPVQPSFSDRAWAQPAVVNDVVFTATDHPYAFKAGCAARGATCRPLWVGPKAPGGRNRYFAPSATDRELFMTAEPLVAFSLP